MSADASKAAESKSGVTVISVPTAANVNASVYIKDVPLPSPSSQVTISSDSTSVAKTTAPMGEIATEEERLMLEEAKARFASSGFNRESFVSQDEGVDGGVSSFDELPVAFKSAAEAGLLKKSDTGYVGLLNQGATCYLNSLLQSLFMTPPFKKALFEWTYNSSKHGAPEFCIPYQLQLLFARLSLTKRSAVSTTDLTKSFRWNAAEAFRQHDIQELMRVLFDALEKTLHIDPSNSFVNELYQGFIGDYISCPSCGYKSERKEKYLDISLVIKGTGSVREAIANYVSPEVLSGDNLWRCSGCGKRVEARKGLRFDSLPHVLTVQLKRFVYDPIKRGRVKLQDKVTFEERLDMTEFIQRSETDPATVVTANPSDVPSLLKQKSIDELLGKSAAGHVYQLFAILMHSGTAMGGHYYAYIKSPTNQKWVEFNDSVVSYIDTEKAFNAAFGGVENGASAYLLMFRRVLDTDTAAQTESKTAAEASLPVPEDLGGIIASEDAAWELEQAALEKERRMLDLCVVHKNKEHRYRFDKGEKLSAVQETIRQQLGLADTLAADQVRLRFFIAELGCAQATFTGMEEKSLEECGFKRNNTLVLETREKDQEFPVYNPNAFPVRIRRVTPTTVSQIIDESDLPLASVFNPSADGGSSVSTDDLFTVQVDKSGTVRSLKEAAAEVTGIPADEQILSRINYHRAVQLDDDSITLQTAEVGIGRVVYCERADPAKPGTSIVVDYFNVSRGQITVEFNDPDRVLDDGTSVFKSVRVGRQSNLGQLKGLVGTALGLFPEEFRLRSSANGPIFKDEGAPLDELKLTDHSVVFVERGRPLKKDEFDIKFFLYSPEKEKAQFSLLFIMPFHKMTKVSDMKKQLVAYLNEVKPNGKGGNTLNISYLRLREKQLKQAGKIFIDSSTLHKNAPRLADGHEIAIQKIDQPEEVTNLHKSVFVQQFRPDTLTLDRKTEIIIRSNETVGPLKDMLASMFDIPRDRLGIAKGPSITEADVAQVSKLNFNDPKVFDEMMITLMPLRIRDGDLVLFQDNGSSRTEQKTPVQKKGPSRFSKYNNKKADGDVLVPRSNLAKEHALQIFTEADLQEALLAEQQFAAEKARREALSASLSTSTTGAIDGPNGRSTSTPN